MSDNIQFTDFDQVQNNQAPQFNPEPIQAKVSNETIFSYGDKTYTLDSNRVKFGDMLRLSAKLKSGMKAILHPDQTTEMLMTEEYAGKESEVISELATKLFALDFKIDDLEFEKGFELFSLIKETSFLERLQKVGDMLSKK